jgi:hypothetical protein
MNEKILCFSLNGFIVAVPVEQVEKILINKHPTKDTFTLETGVEVKSLKSYIPLPEKEEVPSENILFIKDQRDYYGFTVDRIIGYLRLRASERIGPKKPDSPIQFFVRSESGMIPVMDLQYVTNNEKSVTNEDIEEIVSAAGEEGGATVGEETGEAFEEVSEEEIYRSIDEEIQKNKRLAYADDVISSERKGIVLPLVVNVAIVVVFLAGFLFYLTTTREKANELEVGGKISGVEEEVIREIRRKSEQEVAEQKEKLQEARSRLNSLQKEKEFFIQNQDSILADKEKALQDEYNRRLEEARQRIAESGVENADAKFEQERQRLYEEFLQSRESARDDVEQVKLEYENALQQKEQEIRNEVDVYSKRIGEIEQQLVEEQAKLKESEERFQSAVSQQQEYMTFRKQLNTVYNRGLNYLARKEYDRGIGELKTIPPIIAKAREAGIGDEVGLNVEEKLVNNLLWLADQEKNRLDLSEIGEKTYNAANELEREQKREEALSRYFTVYTIAEDTSLRSRALARAQVIMDELYNERTAKENEEAENKASVLFQQAMDYKRAKNYDEALTSLQELVTEQAPSSKSKQALDEIVAINKLIAKGEEDKVALGANEKAAEIMASANKSYESGYYTEALDKYQDVVKKYRDTNYADDALNEIVRINEEMRGFKSRPQLSVKGRESNTGVVIQSLSENSFLFSLGSEDNVKEGEVLQLYRKEGDSLLFIGSMKVTDVYPTISRGRIVYYERKPKAGDLVTF